MRVTYYPITYYHLLLSIIMRESDNKCQSNVVLDKNIFGNDIVKRMSLESNSRWSKIYVIEERSKTRLYLNKFYLKAIELIELDSIKNETLVFFSPGDYYCTSLVNTVYKENSVFMGDDGVAPYYFDNMQSDWSFAIEQKSIIGKIRRTVKYLINPNLRFNSSILSGLLTFKKDWMSDSILNKLGVKEITPQSTVIERACDEINFIFNYKQKSTLNNIDIIYFDHGSNGNISKENELKLMCHLFSTLKGKKVYIKLRGFDNDQIEDRVSLFNAVGDRVSCDILFHRDLAKYPWELLYYNNRDSFKDAIFMATYFTTALISPTILFGVRHKTFILSDVFYPNDSKNHCSDLIRSCVCRINKTNTNFYIFIPKSLDEVDIAALI